MKRELQDQLFTKYPKIFRQKDESMQVTCMCWGIATGDGWYDLLDELCGKLQAYIDEKAIPQVEAVQVKEKFGTLRFYVGGVHKDAADDVYNMINEAERKSGRTCDVCGEPGETSGWGWISTRCKEHDESSRA